MSRPEKNKDLGNGVRPQAALGVKCPIWRLGALVSLPYSIGKVTMVQRPDRSLLLRHMLHALRRKRFHGLCFLTGCSDQPLLRGKRWGFPEQTEPIIKGSIRDKGRRIHKAISPRPRYGSGPCRQGIARHVPPCPAALHLDCSALRQKCAARKLLCEKCFLPTDNRRN